MSEVYNDETTINNLVDQFKSTGEEQYRMKLLEAFDPYFNKYVYLLCSTKPVDINNKDTVTFLRLFMNDEDRSNYGSISNAAKRTISFLRGVFSDCEPGDIYDEMVCVFLEQLNRYKPMIANHTPHKQRISFTHFLQVNTRYRIKNIAVERSKDVLYGISNIEYYDEMAGAPSVNGTGKNYGRIDFLWVRGDTAGDAFNQLEEYERYLLFLKYENGESKPLSDYDLARLTGQDRMYVRRKMLKIKDKLKELVGQT
jgi:hypothetical protein